MSLFNRLTQWAANQLLTSASLNGEFDNLVNGLNNLDSGNTSWTNVKGTTLSGTTVNGTTNLQKAGLNLVAPLQAVIGTSTSVDTTTSGTFVSTSLSATMTIQSASSKILVLMSGVMQSGSGSASLSIFRSTNLLSSGGAFRMSAGIEVPCSLVFLDAPGSTGSTTWTVKFLSGGGTAQFGETNVTNSLILVEFL